MGEVLVTIAAIAIILFNIIGIIWLGISLEHPFLVTIAYIVVLVVIGNINGYVCLIVALAVAVISLIVCIYFIVCWCKEEIEITKEIKEEKQRNIDLLEAVKNGDVESAKMLIEKGGNIKYCDSEKQEPMLQIAIKKSDKEMVSLLLDNGADENCVCNGKTPLDFATNEEIIILLKSKGAKSKAELEAEEIRKKEEAEEWNTMGNAYFEGKLVEKDYKKAVEFWEKAVELGNIEAHNGLAICYMFAYGVDRDYAKAFKLNEVAAEAGVANAQCNLGLLYSKGLGVYQSDTLAMHWWEKAAGQGHSDAQCNLGLYCLEKNATKALYWFDKAAEQENVNAFYCKGLYYDKIFDYQNAGLWFEKAATRGHEKALERLRDLCSRGLYYIIE